MRNKGILITATDTGVGKTLTSFALGVLMQEKWLDVGYMKPVQCAGDDALFIKKSLGLSDSLEKINPFFAPEALSPHLAFKRAKIEINIPHIIETFHEIQRQHDVTIVEGAGGLLVPIKNNYFVADLIRDLDLDVIIVARPGLGTINHTLLTIKQAEGLGIRVKGVVFNTLSEEKLSIPEKTNPQAIEQLSGVPILGVLPFLKTLERKEILKKCAKRIKLEKILEAPKEVRSEGLESLDKKYVWHPFTQMKDWLENEPLVIEEAKGCHLKDTNGRWYIDGVSSLWVNIHGHNHPEINKAVKAQLDKVAHSTFLGLSNVPAINLAKKLVEIAPKGLEKVFYSDNGSTAVEVAIKMAYQFWQNKGQKTKTGMVHLEHSYHGDTLGSVSVGGIDLFHKVYGKIIFKTIKISSPAVDTKKFLTELEKLLKKRGNKVAALIVEPLIQGAAGMLVWPKGILKKIEQLCRRYDVLLICDEVATGFGRTGKMFACEHEDVRPDILCLAKGLTGGYLPLAATLTTKRIFNRFLFDYKEQKTFFHGHTYTANPLACAAALANLDIFEKERTLENLQLKIKLLAKSLKKFYNLAHVGSVRRQGFMAGIELFKDKSKNVSYLWEEKMGIKVCQEARRQGVILRPLGNVIVLMPPLSISAEELEKLLSVTYKAIKEVTEVQSQGVRA